MGVIKDIVDIIVQKALKRIEEHGLDIREALKNELRELGYMSSENKEDNEECYLCGAAISSIDYHANMGLCSRCK